MKVHQLMSRNVECTRPDATLHQAADRMKDFDVGSLPVCQQDQLVGMITDRDIVVRSVADGHDPEMDRVSDIMSSRFIYCFDDDEVEEAAQIMKEKQIRRLPILNHNMQLVGIVSLGDLATDSSCEKLAGEALEAISEPSIPIR